MEGNPSLSTIIVLVSTGSAYGVVRYFAENNLSFPKRAYGDGSRRLGNIHGGKSPKPEYHNHFLLICRAHSQHMKMQAARRAACE